MNIYSQGDLVRVSSTFTNSAGVAIDPSVVKLDYRTPALVTTTLVYGTDAALVKDSTGHYHADISGASVGVWLYRWYATGTGQSAAEEMFQVQTLF